MTFANYDLSKNKFLGALILDRIFPKHARKIFTHILSIGLFISILPLAIAWGVKFSTDLSTIYETSPAGGLNTLWFAIFYILLALKLAVLAIEGFYYSKTFAKKGETTGDNLARRLDFYATELAYKSIYVANNPSTSGLAEALLKTQIGQMVLTRLGISLKEYISFFHSPIKPHSDAKPLREYWDNLNSKIKPSGDITFTDMFSALFEAQLSFADFFTRKNITLETIQDASKWIEKEFKKEDLEKRWWRREHLGRIPGLAKDWSYGHTYFLEKFATDLSREALLKETELIGHDHEIKLVETALLKNSSANVIIVGAAGSGKRAILLGLVRMIARGKIFPDLEHKRILELSGPTIIAEGKTKGEIEKLLITILNEAVSAGNVILAISEFPEFVNSLSEVGVSAGELFSPYLSSSSIHITALADSLNYRRILENNKGLTKYFAKIDISEPDQTKLIEILAGLVPETETRHRNKIFFTYTALQKISEAASRYLVEGAMPKRAIDLMESVAEEARAKGTEIIIPELVMEIVSRKTNMPLGKIDKEEQEKLLNLESLLHKRVVGQDEAIEAIANSIRRARSGIQNPKRPLGTFLFLGPTGVGKTESAKALAEVYFKNEEAMVRLDMTEYQTEENIKMLTGSFEKNEPGILASKIKSNPYSVLLLDEFEKSHLKVKNLFLQILDEGFFSDYLGERINMRNTIIIATSNAGANLIIDLVRQGKNPAEMKETILTEIRKEKILSPELLNRFDAVIVFRPLDHEVLKTISSMMLEKLALRLKKQNLKLKITDSLIDAVAKGGYNPTMGARPMQRFIQDRVEEIIAEKIIKKEIEPGVEFELSL